jgi:hypothetical protein
VQIALRHAQRSGTESYHFSTFIIIVARARVRTRVDTAGAIYEASKYKRGHDHSSYRCSRASSTGFTV